MRIKRSEELFGFAVVADLCDLERHRIGAVLYIAEQVTQVRGEFKKRYSYILEFERVHHVPGK